MREPSETTTPNYTLRQYGSDDGSWAYLVSYPSVGSPWITERLTQGKAMTVHQAKVLFDACAENTITLGFENIATGERAVLVKPEGMRGWSAGSPVSFEEFIHLLNTCYVHTCPETSE